MDVVIRPGAELRGTVAVPGDKSIAHRWLILAATAQGRSRIDRLPPSLDLRSTAGCLAMLAPKARPSLDLFAREGASWVEGGGSTWNVGSGSSAAASLEVEGEGRGGLVEPAEPLDCGNSGTTMRLLSGLLASAPFRTKLRGDDSLSRRPMERVAEPLRRMGAAVTTVQGHAPVTVEGARLHGIEFAPTVASAQVKGAVLLAGLDADGETLLREPADTRDHTERALAWLGAPVAAGEGVVRLSRGSFGGFDAAVPGDVSSAAFLIAAAALTGSELTVEGVGCNPSRLHFLAVMRRMGIEVSTSIEREEVGEPVGTIHVERCSGILPVRVEPGELPLIVDEVPILAALAAFAPGDSWFLEAAELRVKESDRLRAVAAGIRALGGTAADEGADLVVAGGGLTGGRATSAGDHRMAMTFAVAALAAEGPSRIDGIDAADVSFPGFVDVLRAIGAELEVV